MSLSLEDLTSKGSRGEELRKGLAQAVAEGASDPELCVQLAMMCQESGQADDALWFLGVGAKQASPVDKKWPKLTAGLLIDIFEDIQDDAGPAALEKGVFELFSSLDGLHADFHEIYMQVFADDAAEHPKAFERLVDLFEEFEPLLNSESFLCLAFAVRQFEGGCEAAGKIAKRLAEWPNKSRWTYRLLAKLAALRGDYAETENLCRQALRIDGEKFLLQGELAAALFCQGKEKEGREYLVRCLSRSASDEGREKRLEHIRQWAHSLEEAMEKNIADGGAFDRIGAAANYTDSETVNASWPEHLEKSVEKNTYRTVAAYTNTVMFNRVEELLLEHSAIGKVINYGTLCGIREFELASRRPGTLFAGYDISSEATEMNREKFQLDNLMFASNLDDLLGGLESKPGEAVLAHCRTADIMFPEAVKKVYRCCHSHGVKYILAAEYFSICISTLDYPDFEANPVDTVHWDGILMIHDYGKIFAETGYRVTSSEYRPVPLLVDDHGGQAMLLIWLVVGERMDAAGGAGPQGGAGQ